MDQENVVALSRMKRSVDVETHLRLWGLDQKIGESPTKLHVGIEEGGTLTDLQGKTIWGGLISAESFEETMIAYLESFPESIDATLMKLSQKVKAQRTLLEGWKARRK